MLAGYRGHLIATNVLEELIAHTHPASLGAPRPHGRMWPISQQMLGPASSLRAMLEAGAAPLMTMLGFEGVDAVALDPAPALATIRSQETRVTLVITSWGERLDGYWRSAIIASAQRATDWCLLYNGVQLRLLHASRTHSRRFAEFDLDVAGDDPRTGAALRAVVSPSRFQTVGAHVHPNLMALIAASDALRSRVCRSLRHGVLDASGSILTALIARRERPLIAEAFEQSLILVYRMLFLLFAEARVLVPLWHPVYRQSYSLEQLRARASQGLSAGLWDALRAIGRLAHAGCRAGDLIVTPFNGRLFAPSRTPLAERRDLDDEAACRAVLALTTEPSADREGRVAIGYHDLGVEQLGAVYETLLDYTPHVRRETAVVGSGFSRIRPGARHAPSAASHTERIRLKPDSTTAKSSEHPAGTGLRPARSRLVVSLQPGASARKATGSFYTPQSIAAFLIRQTLGPLVRDAAPEEILALKVLDPSMGSGAFLVGACAYLADAYETALVRSGGCHAHDLGPTEHAMIRRTIAERCLYGVDLNPMAVQLAKLSLWLTTLAADRPLSFLDHNLQVGDSLLGAWLTNLRQPPVLGTARRGALPLFDVEPGADRIRGWLPIRFNLAQAPNDTPEHVRAKERALAALNDPRGPLAMWRRIADLWCAYWFAADLSSSPATFTALTDHVLNGRGPLAPRMAETLLDRAAASAAARRFFHWELEFPEVFFASNGERRVDGGFDAVIGNPPWDMLRADVKDRDADSERDLASRSVRFTRQSGIYSAQSDGHANRYQLFLERAIAVTRPRGRLGLVLPFGLASDHGSASLRRLLFSRCSVESLVGFDNRRAIFPIHRSVRFLLLTAAAGSPTTDTLCRFGETDVSELDRADADGVRDRRWFPVRLTPALIERLSGDDLAIPEFRTARDLAIAERAAALFPPLGSDAGWQARFGRELNATEDRKHFSTSGSGIPVVGGKHLRAFGVDLERASHRISRVKAERLLGGAHARARLAYRDVASATNRMTLIAAILPAGCASVHTVFCLKQTLPAAAQHFLCALFNSFVVNHLVRLRVTTHVTTASVERLPIPRQFEAGPAFDEIVTIAKVLRHAAGSQPQARMNALVARIYQLSYAEFSYVLDSFPLVPAAERAACLHEFLTIQGEG